MLTAETPDLQGSRGTVPAEPAALQSNAIGLLGATTFGVVMLSPAMTIYGNFGPSFLAAGTSAPVAFVLALIATLPTAVSYALLSRELPDSGSAASWASRAFPRAWGGSFARWVGWMVFLYYLTNFIIQPVYLGVFFNDLLTNLGLKAATGTYVLGAMLCCGWPAWLTYKGIQRSEAGAAGFLIFEALVVPALCLTVYAALPHDGAHFTAAGFRASAVVGNRSGILHAMIFGMLAFCGFDVISTLSEEAQMPRKLIPQATFLALFVFGAIIIGGIWILTFAAGPERMRQVADSGGMPVSEIARMFWGRWAILVPITAISSALGLSIATAVGASRVLLSIGRRQGSLRWLSVLHPRYKVPWNGMNVIFATGLISAVATGLMLGPYQTWVWWGTTSTFFAMVTYFMVNLTNLVLFRQARSASAKGFLLHGLVPLFGLAADGYILVQSFFIDLWRQGWATGQSVVIFDVVCAGVAVLAAVKSRDGAALAGRKPRCADELGGYGKVGRGPDGLSDRSGDLLDLGVGRIDVDAEAGT